MKKKLNLLWNLKFNFFSVAERPLTFFAYFLNAKKVGRRRLVIGPAKAGAFLFSHTRLPFPPRLLLPFSRISPAAKPGWPVIGPTFWVCRAKSRAAFRCAKPPCAVVRFAAMASPPRTAILPFPSRLRRAGSPTAKPRRLSPFGSISLRETARSVVASAGAGTGSRVWEKRKAPRCRGADYEICRWRYFLNVKKVTKEHRGRSVRLKNHDFKFRIKS